MDIWKDLNFTLEPLTESYLLEMSMPLNIAKAKIESRSDNVVEHILKCLIYKDTTKNLNHWMQELGGWLEFCGSITIKPKNKKLNPNQYRTWLFGYWFEDEENLKIEVKDFKNKYSNKYPDFEITEDLIKFIFNIGNILINAIIDIMRDKTNYSSNSYCRLIKEILIKNNIK